MRVAALYDVHGHLPALEAVLAEFDQEGVADEIVVGGDVLWGPMQSECPGLDIERAVAELRNTSFPGFDEVFARSLEGGVTAAEAITEFESKRGA